MRSLPLAMIGVLGLLAADLAVAGGLEVHPENHHYFRDTATGKPVVIAAYGTIAPTSGGGDYERDVRELVSRRASYVRVWHLLPWDAGARWPWAKVESSAGAAKYDFDRWDPEYWSKLVGCLAALEKAGIYAEIIVFDRCGMSDGLRDRWGRNPWASDNNVNAIELPPGAGSGVPGFYEYESKPNLRKYQEAYVRKLIDETIRFRNVIYEVENEHMGHSDPAWARHYARFIRGYIAERYPGRRRLVAYNSLSGDLEACFGEPAIDVVNKHYGGQLEMSPSTAGSYIEERWKFGKPINIDEFANGLANPGVLREECWTILMSGGHFHIEDADPASKPFEAVGRIREFIAKSGWDFIHAAPNRRLIGRGGGYCMANPGKEYAMYFPKGGRKELALPTGRYSIRWWNPRSGGFTGSTLLRCGSTPAVVNTPDGLDWAFQARALKPE